ncbi:MAG: TetR/AcrR family transcriptional regulator [Acutalibacteraceae bacterium]
MCVGKRKTNTEKEETRKAILDAAVAICLEDGFEELSIRKITDRLGYSSGIVYHYFKDKQEILDTIHQNTILEIKEAVTNCMKPDRNFAENLRVIYKMLAEITVYQPDTFKLILLGRYGQPSSQSNSSTELWIEMIKQCIDMGIASGELREIDSVITAYTLLNAFLVVQMIIYERGETDKKTVIKIFDTELDIILHGILNKEEREDV